MAIDGCCLTLLKSPDLLNPHLHSLLLPAIPLLLHLLLSGSPSASPFTVKESSEFIRSTWVASSKSQLIGNPDLCSLCLLSVCSHIFPGYKDSDVDIFEAHILPTKVSIFFFSTLSSITKCPLLSTLL